jgi:hypothetical protein
MPDKMNSYTNKGNVAMNKGTDKKYANPEFGKGTAQGGIPSKNYMEAQADPMAKENWPDDVQEDQ